MDPPQVQILKLISKFSPPQTFIALSYVPRKLKYDFFIENNPPAMVGDRIGWSSREWFQWSDPPFQCASQLKPQKMDDFSTKYWIMSFIYYVWKLKYFIYSQSNSYFIQTISHEKIPFWMNIVCVMLIRNVVISIFSITGVITAEIRVNFLFLFSFEKWPKNEPALLDPQQYAPTWARSNLGHTHNERPGRSEHHLLPLQLLLNGP